MLVVGSQWYGEPESCSLSWLRLNPQPASMTLNDSFRDRQSKAGAGHVPAVEPGKYPEDPFLVLARDAFSVICYGEYRLRPVLLPGYSDVRSNGLSAILHCV